MPLFGARNCYASMYAMALCWLLPQLMGILCTVITSIPLSFSSQSYPACTITSVESPKFLYQTIRISLLKGASLPGFSGHLRAPRVSDPLDAWCTVNFSSHFLPQPSNEVIPFLTFYLSVWFPDKWSQVHAGPVFQSVVGLTSMSA
jgi:hypothetical protein